MRKVRTAIPDLGLRLQHGGVGRGRKGGGLSRRDRAGGVQQPGRRGAGQGAGGGSRGAGHRPPPLRQGPRGARVRHPGGAGKSGRRTGRPGRIYAHPDPVPRARLGWTDAEHPPIPLPKYPGLHTHRRAIEAGDTEAGVTVHLVTTDLDAGPILGQARVPVLAGDTEETLAARVLAEEHRLYPACLAEVARALQEDGYPLVGDAWPGAVGKHGGVLS